MPEKNQTGRDATEGEAAIRALIDHNSDAILVIGADYVIRFANPAAEQLFGRPRTGLVGAPFGFPIENQKADTIQVLDHNNCSRTAEMRVTAMTWQGEAAHLVSLRDISARMETEVRLRASEHKLRSLFQNARDAIYITTRRGRFLEFNPAMLDLSGYSRKAFESLNIQSIWADPEDRIDFQVAVESRGEVQDYPAIFQRNDKSRIDCLVSATLLMDENSRIIGYQGIIRDVTREMETQQAIYAERFKLKAFFENMPVAAFQVSLEGTILEYNDLAGRFFNKSGKCPATGTPLAGLLAGPESPGKIDEQMRRIQAEGRLVDSQLRISESSGKARDILFNCETIFDRNRTPLFRLATLRDISELIQYRSQLEEMVAQRTRELNRALYDTEEARDRIDGILKSMADGLIVTDTYHRIILMNPAAEDLLGIRFSRVIDRSIDFAVREPMLQKKIKATLEKSRIGESFDFDMPGDTSDPPRVLRAGTAAIKDKRGRLSGIVTILRDITHERELDRLKDAFISTAAHELRTPMTSIQGFSEILLTRENIDDAEQKKFLSYINEKATGLSRILNDLLDLARIESGNGFAFRKARTDLSAFLRRAVDSFRAQANSRDLRLRLPETPLFLEFDPQKLEQVLENLLSNAVKYSPAGGPIRITADMEKDACTIVVEDHGMGMTKDQARQIFEKFYRADETNTNISGTGLGMSIVKRIVEGHDGTVRVESKVGQGTRVTVTLPAGG